MCDEKKNPAIAGTSHANPVLFVFLGDGAEALVVHLAVFEAVGSATGQHKAVLSQ